MSRWRWAATGVLLALALVLGLWWGTGSAPPTTATPSPDQPEVHAPLVPAVVTQPQATTAPDPAAPAPPLSAAVALTERLAQQNGLLHVRCFVGEEYAPVRGVEDGWYAFNTIEREGQRRLGDIAHDALMVVRWSAPPGAPTTHCVPEPARWGYLTVVVFEEDGGPAAGVGVSGCGALHETGPDGRVEFPVLVGDDPCVLDVFRWDSPSRTHAQAYIRLAPLAPDEERTVTARLRDFPMDEGEPSPQFDLAAVLDPELAASGVPEIFEPPTLQDRIADYEDRLQSTEDYIADLQAVLPQTPEDERWLVEERLGSAQNSREAFAAHLDELNDEAATETD